MYQDYFTRMMEKHNITGEITSENLLELVEKFREEDTPREQIVPEGSFKTSKGVSGKNLNA